MTTSVSRHIWIVIFNDGHYEKLREQRVAAKDLREVLSYFNDVGLVKIVKIEKTDHDITYQY